MMPTAVLAFLGLISSSESMLEIHAGRGACVESGDRYTITYLIALPGGKELADSGRRGLPYSKELGDGHDGYFDTWAQGMRLGSERQIELRASSIPEALKETVPGNIGLIVILRLVGLKKKSVR